MLAFSQLCIVNAPLKKNPKLLFHPHAEHFWDTKYKIIFNFFAFIKKIILQTLVLKSFGTPYKQNEKIKNPIWSAGYQNRVKSVRTSSFLK